MDLTGIVEVIGCQDIWISHEGTENSIKETAVTWITAQIQVSTYHVKITLLLMASQNRQA